MIIFGSTQLVLSQIPDFHELSWLSIVATIMYFAYSSIGLALSIAKVAGEGLGNTTLTGIPVGANMTYMDKDTLKSPPAENKQMKKASLFGVSTTTLFYIFCGCFDYAAFGNDAPGNFLTGFGFYDPFWLIDLANIFIVVHLVGAYQVFAQPVFLFVETWSKHRWPNNKFINKEHPVVIPFGRGVYYFNWFRFVWRSMYVIVTSLLAMMFPFFNDVLGLLGAVSFWPLTVFFPVELHIAQAKVPKYSPKWIALKLPSYVCLVLSLIVAAGSLQGLIIYFGKYRPFEAS
ncbi:hypothetical protein vseg_007351 [Gypsophila vaccaria]